MRAKITNVNLHYRIIPAKSVVVLQLQVRECEGVAVLEHVQAKLTISAHRRGDLKIQLTSPMGTRVTLLAHRFYSYFYSTSKIIEANFQLIPQGARHNARRVQPLAVYVGPYVG